MTLICCSGRSQGQQDYRNSVANDAMGSPRNIGHMHDMAGNRNSMHDRSGYNGDISSRSNFCLNKILNADGNFRNVKPIFSGMGGHEQLTPRNSNERPNGVTIPQRPTNLLLDNSRKHMIETKTDYGKYR